MFYDLSLNVTNISDGRSLNCSVRVDLPAGSQNNGSTTWVRCSVAGPSTPDASIDVSLDTNYGIFGLRQAWECSDGVAGVERYLLTTQLRSPRWSLAYFGSSEGTSSMESHTPTSVLPAAAP